MRCNVLIPRLKTAHGIHWDSLGRIGQIAGSLPEIPFLGSVTIRSERVACPCPTKWWSVHNHKISFFRGRPKMLKPKTISNASKKNTVSILIFLSHSFVGVWELNAGIADGQSGIPGLLLVCAKEGRGFLGEASSMVGFAADASWNHYLWGQNPSKFPRSWGAANCEDGCRMLQEFLDPSWKPIPRTRQMQADDVPSIGCWLVNACLYRCTFSTPTKRHLHSLLTILGLSWLPNLGKLRWLGSKWPAEEADWGSVSPVWNTRNDMFVWTYRKSYWHYGIVWLHDTPYQPVCWYSFWWSKFSPTR